MRINTKIISLPKLFRFLCISSEGMKKKISALFFLIAVFFNAVAHTNMYYSAFGLRAGKFNSGVSYKHFYGSDNATGIQVDGYITHMADGGFTVKGFYLRQIPFKLPVIQLPLDFIYGFGLHGGYFPVVDRGYYKIRKGEPVYYNKDVFCAGVDATVQIEYQVSRKLAPITVTLDGVPFYEFFNEGPEHIDFGISVRYIFR